MAFGLQTTPLLAREFLIKKYDDLDYLPSLNVSGVTQDHSGRMWFSTRAGLVRYDGATWEVVNPPTKRSPQSYRHVVCDDRGHIWALAVDLPFLISHFDGKEWDSYEISPPKDWGWDVLGFMVMSQPDGTVHMAMISDRILSYWDGKQWLQFGQDGSLNGIKSFVFLDNRIYMATADGLMACDISAEMVYKVTAEGKDIGTIQALAVDHNRDPGLWLVGTDWIGRLGNGELEKYDTGLRLDISKLEMGTQALIGPAGGIIFGGVEDLFYFHPQRGLRFLDKGNGLVTNGAISLFLDREQNIWITTLRGISKLVSMRLENYNSSDGLAYDEVSAIIQRPNGSMVLGHNSGLTILSPRVIPLPVERDVPGDGRVMDLECDPQGRLWIAFDEWGLALMRDDLTLQWFGQEDGLSKYVYAILFDRNGEMWVGGSGGLYRKNGDSFQSIPMAGPDPNVVPFIRRISEGKDGALLLASGMQGAFRIKNGVVEQWNEPQDGVLRSCYQVVDRGAGNFWVATSAGLCRVKNGRLERTTAPDPEIHRPIYSILEDNQHNFWFGTDRGILRWDGLKMTEFGPNEGVLGGEFNRDALMQATDGAIWMGTDLGLTIYDPLFDQARKAPPLVEIHSPIVDGVPEDLQNGLELGPSVFECVFPFSGISFLDEEGLTFRTWLEGLEPQWQRYRKFPSRSIRYLNLAPGEYRFHLQARNIAGVESEIQVSNSFRVQAPLTQTWWFLLLEILGGLLLAMGIVYIIMGRRFQDRLQQEVRQRTRELRKTERAVRSESQRLFAVLSSISDGVLAVDNHLKVVICNPMALGILGVQLDAVLGKELSSVFVVEPSLVIDGTVCPAFSAWGGNPSIPVHQFTNQFGEVRTLEISLASMSLGDGLAKGWVLAFRDVTDRQRLERELMRSQQLESLGVLAGGIAHDFNNLLTIMLGNLSLVENSNTFGDSEKFRLGRMKVATLRARDLAEQLLTFARGGEPVMQSVNLGELVEQVTSFALSGSKVSSRIKISEDLWLVEGDPGQLGQVVSNLVINAMQAMPDGGGMELELHNLPSMPGRKETVPCVGMVIRDRGEGIDPENLDQIFNPYFSTKGTGSGLGLTIAYSIVSHHGGIIQVESRQNGGTVFRVYLPSDLSSPALPIENAAQRFPAGLRVLVLDDEKDVLLLAEQMLVDLGLQVVCVANGEMAVDAFARALGKNRAFDVIIADLTIPGGLGGVEAFQKIRAMDGSVGGIVTSGYSNDKVMANYQKFGFSAAVHKPFDQEQLAASLAKALNNNRFRKS